MCIAHSQAAYHLPDTTPTANPKPSEKRCLLSHRGAGLNQGPSSRLDAHLTHMVAYGKALRRVFGIRAPHSSHKP